MPTDIEIAQSVQMKKITDIAKTAGIDEKYIEQYGNYKAKIDLSILSENKNESGKLVLVTAITPTPAGEGKTTTTIGLADGMKKLGKNPCPCEMYIAVGSQTPNKRVRKCVRKQ